MEGRAPLALLFLAVLPARAQDPAWEKVSDKDGIAVYARKQPGSRVVAFKGEGEIAQPLPKVASVFNDCTRAKEWADNIVESRVDHWVGPREYVEYDRVRMPLVLSDRDFVTDVKVEVSPDGKRIAFLVASVEDPALPKRPGVVRGRVISASSVMTSVGGGRTVLSAEMQADPKGVIPLWVVNWFQKSWAPTAFKSLRRQTGRSDVAVTPFIASLFDAQASR